MSDEKKSTPALDAGLSIENQLFEGRTVLISAPVDSKLSHVINSKLLALEKANGEAPIYIYINSPGGEVHSGFSIFDMIRFIQCPVTTIVTGLAASMGSIIALAAKPERRFALPNSKFLVHQPSVSGGLGGSVSDIEIHARDLLETKNKIIEIYVKETGKKIADIQAALDRDHWLSPEQAKAFGLVSQIISSRSQLK